MASGSGIRWYWPQNHDVMDIGPSERISYIGCIHQMTEDLGKRLKVLIASPPDCLILGGDLTGSKEFDTLKYHFYEVVKIGRDQLKLHESATTMPTAAILAASRGVIVDGKERTLREEYLDFSRYELGLNNLEVTELSDAEIVRRIGDLCQFKDYGSYAKTLPQAVRERLADSFADTSKALLPYLRELQEAGVRVHIIAGNWDNVENTARNVGMDTVFDAANFFNRAGIWFHESIVSIFTKRSVQVLVPYWEIWPTLKRETIENLMCIREMVNYERADGKTIIVTAHGQPLWEPHRPGKVCQDYNVDVMKNLAWIIDLLRPHELIYPHQHDPMQDSDGRALDINTHYFIASLGNGEIRAVRADDNMTDWIEVTLATYIPLRRVAHLNIPLQGKHHHPLVLGGARLPAMVE